jgi:vitamin B12 transporter
VLFRSVSSIYGSAAVGGVIQIFTKAGTGASGMAASAEAGSRGTYRLSASTGGGSEGLTYGVAVSEYSTDGFSAVNTGQRPSANPDKDGYRNQSINGSLIKRWREGQEFGVRLSHSRGKSDYDSAWDSASTKHQSTTEVGAVTLFSNNRVTDSWTSRLSFSQFSDDTTYKTTANVNRDRYLTRTQTAEWTNELTIFSGWRASLGANHQWQNFISEPAAVRSEYQRTSQSVFGGVQGTADRHQIQLNTRYDETAGLSAGTGYAGYGFQFDERFKLIASYSTAFSAPPMGYLYGTYGNPLLKPEHSRSTEGGIQYSDGQSLVRATVFETRTTDQIQWFTTDYNTGDGEFRNLKTTRNRGLELSGVQYVSDWELRASLTVQDPIDLSTNDRLIRRPSMLGSLGAVTKFDKWRVGGNLSYTGSREDYNATGTTTVDPYWLVHLTARYQIDKNLSVFGRIENLLNANYQTAWGYQQPSRGMFMGINWQQ